jgi:hypothetical protein
VPRAYFISRGIAAYLVGFCLVWFGAIVGFVIIGQLPHERTLANMGAMLAAFLVALVPALATALIPYKVTVSDDGMCSFRSLLRERRLRVDQIKEIDWDDDYMIVRHDSGKARVLLDPAFKPFLVRLLELNPMITVPDDLLSSLDDRGAEVL